MSVRTIIRDAVLAQFAALKTSGGGRVKEFAFSPRYLSAEEARTSTTYCVVVTDESRTPHTLSLDAWDATLLCILYAYDTKDPRAKLDLCIEDAIEQVLRVGLAMKAQAWTVRLDEISTDEGTTAAGPWAQAILRWSVGHRRMAYVA